MSTELSVILPAYLEEENLRLLLPRIKETLAHLNISFEVLVVDTMTPMDGTPEACREIGVTYVHREGGNFYGDAVRTGINKCKGNYVIFMDADGSHYPDFLKTLFSHRESADVVIASRYVDGGHTENSKLLVLMSRVVNLGYSLVLGIKCKDVSNSFKLYRGDQLRELTLKCNNFDIVEELLYKLIKKNSNVKLLELPFTFKQRMFGETKRDLPSFIITYIFTLIKLRFLT